MAKKKVNIEDATGLNAAQVQVLKSRSPMGVSDEHIAAYVLYCKSIQIDPFSGEVKFYKQSEKDGGGIVCMAGRDVFFRHAQANNDYAGYRSAEFRKNDIFKPDIPAGQIEHSWNGKLTPKERGAIIGGYCIVYRKDGEPTIVIVYLSDYDTKEGIWKKNPQRMITKVAEATAFRGAFGFSGLQSEYDWSIDSTGIASPIAKEQEPVTDLQAASERLRKLLENAPESLAEEARAELMPLQQAGELTIEVVNKWTKKIGG